MDVKCALVYREKCDKAHCLHSSNRHCLGAGVRSWLQHWHNDTCWHTALITLQPPHYHYNTNNCRLQITAAADTFLPTVHSLLMRVMSAWVYIVHWWPHEGHSPTEPEWAPARSQAGPQPGHRAQGPGQSQRPGPAPASAESWSAILTHSRAIWGSESDLGQFWNTASARIEEADQKDFFSSGWFYCQSKSKSLRPLLSSDQPSSLTLGPSEGWMSDPGHLWEKEADKTLVSLGQLYCQNCQPPRPNPKLCLTLAILTHSHRQSETLWSDSGHLQEKEADLTVVSFGQPNCQNSDLWATKAPPLAGQPSSAILTQWPSSGLSPEWPRSL